MNSFSASIVYQLTRSARTGIIKCIELSSEFQHSARLPNGTQINSGHSDEKLLSADISSLAVSQRHYMQEVSKVHLAISKQIFECSLFITTGQLNCRDGKYQDEEYKKLK